MLPFELQHWCVVVGARVISQRKAGIRGRDVRELCVFVSLLRTEFESNGLCVFCAVKVFIIMLVVCGKYEILYAISFENNFLSSHFFCR
jgi:hypothetical protein